MSFLKKIIGDPNEKYLKSIEFLVDEINSFESEYKKLSDEDLKNKTNEFKERLKNGESLEDLLVEAFATVREVSIRTTEMRLYDVQLMGGITLHRGKIAEMRTGEGKTLVATLPSYLNALEGKGVHVITVNDYLAKRDAIWMGKIYDFLGLSVSIIQNQRVSFVYDELEEEKVKPVSRQDSYKCDITYGTNNEFGFDYLRDNMVQKLEDMVMRPGNETHYAIIDEIDSILIDEARTPLIISAPAEEAGEKYFQFAKLVKNLKENEDYNLDEKLRSATLSEDGITKFEKWLNVENLYVEAGIRTVHHIEQALKAEVLFKKDKDYIVENNEVVIIDEFTGRKMPGRRYSEGLHQAIEAKEHVSVQRESRTLATVTFQNLFRMYKKLSGMTGTAFTEEEEFIKIYNLEVIQIPTNRPDVRIDHSDRIYKNEKGKSKAIIKKIKECQEKGQPILVGTISVEKNEELSQYLEVNGVVHEILNAKNHERESEIIARAGIPGAVTLATNMAGRGVDIKLGGPDADKELEEKVKNAGGLFVLGTERHESRRIDNQLRGRSARQGDPGETQFFVSTEDELMRIFAGDRLKSLMQTLKVPEDMPIEQRMITKMLESAQKKVESHHFDVRKHLLEYDNVLNKQREVIYKKRREILDLAFNELKEIEENNFENIEKQNLHSIILDYIGQEIEFIVSYHTNSEDDTTWNINEVYETVRTIFSVSSEDKEKIFSYLGKSKDNKEMVEKRDDLIKFLTAKAEHEYENLINNLKNQVDKESNISSEDKEKFKNKMVIELQKSVLLRTIDNLWVDYLVALDMLRAGIGLQGYGQRDPLVEYKQESFNLFNQLLSDIQKEIVYTIFKINIGLSIAPSIMADDKMVLKGADKTTNAEAGIVKGKVRDESGKKVGRNDLCPCGSGKKYKKCCGK